MLKTFKMSVITMVGLISLFSCQEPLGPNEPYPNSSMTLEKLDVSCTEAWLRISLTGVDSSASDTIPLILKRDGQTVKTLEFSPPDTTIMDAGLEPSRDYSYTAYRQSVHNTALIDSSAPLTLTTLDTTSHDFTWTIDTLGSYGSYFNDVAIIDENNIWAVGNIETDSGRYNLAKWDGHQWIIDQVGLVGNDLSGIFALTTNDIWVTNGCSPFHWDGIKWTYYRFSSNGVGVNACAGNAIWGSSPEDVYFVGNHGSIVHYDGSGFTRLESGTPFDLYDIWGLDADHIWIVGFSMFSVPYGEAMLTWNGSGWDKVYEFYWSVNKVAQGRNNNSDSEGTSGHALWTNNANEVLIAGFAGCFQYLPFNSTFIKMNDPNLWVEYKIRGNTNQDFLVVGQGSEISHFNGVSWYLYPEIKSLYGGDVAWYSVAMAGDFAVAVGHNYYNHALVALGTR